MELKIKKEITMTLSDKEFQQLIWFIIHKLEKAEKDRMKAEDCRMTDFIYSMINRWYHENNVLSENAVEKINNLYFNNKDNAIDDTKGSEW